MRVKVGIEKMVVVVVVVDKTADRVVVSWSAPAIVGNAGEGPS